MRNGRKGGWMCARRPVVSFDKANAGMRGELALWCRVSGGILFYGVLSLLFYNAG